MKTSILSITFICVIVLFFIANSTSAQSTAWFVPTDSAPNYGTRGYIEATTLKRTGDEFEIGFKPLSSNMPSATSLQLFVDHRCEPSGTLYIKKPVADIKKSHAKMWIHHYIPGTVGGPVSYTLNSSTTDTVAKLTVPVRRASLSCYLFIYRPIPNESCSSSTHPTCTQYQQQPVDIYAVTRLVTSIVPESTITSTPFYMWLQNTPNASASDPSNDSTHLLSYTIGQTQWKTSLPTIGLLYSSSNSQDRLKSGIDLVMVGDLTLSPLYTTLRCPGGPLASFPVSLKNHQGTFDSRLATSALSYDIQLISVYNPSLAFSKFKDIRIRQGWTLYDMTFSLYAYKTGSPVPLSDAVHMPQEDSLFSSQAMPARATNDVPYIEYVVSPDILSESIDGERTLKTISRRGLFKPGQVMGNIYTQSRVIAPYTYWIVNMTIQPISPRTGLIDPAATPVILTTGPIPVEDKYLMTMDYMTDPVSFDMGTLLLNQYDHPIAYDGYKLEISQVYIAPNNDSNAPVYPLCSESDPDCGDISYTTPSGSVCEGVKFESPHIYFKSDLVLTESKLSTAYKPSDIDYISMIYPFSQHGSDYTWSIHTIDPDVVPVNDKPTVTGWLNADDPTDDPAVIQRRDNNKTVLRLTFKSWWLGSGSYDDYMKMLFPGIILNVSTIQPPIYSTTPTANDKGTPQQPISQSFPYYGPTVIKNPKNTPSGRVFTDGYTIDIILDADTFPANPMDIVSITIDMAGYYAFYYNHDNAGINNIVPTGLITLTPPQKISLAPICLQKPGLCNTFPHQCSADVGCTGKCVPSYENAKGVCLHGDFTIVDTQTCKYNCNCQQECFPSHNGGQLTLQPQQCGGGDTCNCAGDKSNTAGSYCQYLQVYAIIDADLPNMYDQDSQSLLKDILTLLRELDYGDTLKKYALRPVQHPNMPVGFIENPAAKVSEYHRSFFDLELIEGKESSRTCENGTTQDTLQVKYKAVVNIPVSGIFGPRGVELTDRAYINAQQYIDDMIPHVTAVMEDNYEFNTCKPTFTLGNIIYPTNRPVNKDTQYCEWPFLGPECSENGQKYCDIDNTEYDASIHPFDDYRVCSCKLTHTGRSCNQIKKCEAEYIALNACSAHGVVNLLSSGKCDTKCTCDSGYEGTYCEKQTNTPCDGLCDTRTATCVVTPTSAQCQCRNEELGWKQLIPGPSSGLFTCTPPCPCFNKGTCTWPDRSFVPTCTCPTGFYGPLCQGVVSTTCKVREFAPDLCDVGDITCDEGSVEPSSCQCQSTSWITDPAIFIEEPTGGGGEDEGEPTNGGGETSPIDDETNIPDNSMSILQDGTAADDNDDNQDKPENPENPDNEQGATYCNICILDSPLDIHADTRCNVIGTHPLSYSYHRCSTGQCTCNKGWTGDKCQSEASYTEITFRIDTGLNTVDADPESYATLLLAYMRETAFSSLKGIRDDSLSQYINIYTAESLSIRAQSTKKASAAADDDDDDGEEEEEYAEDPQYVTASHYIINTSLPVKDWSCPIYTISITYYPVPTDTAISEIRCIVGFKYTFIINRTLLVDHMTNVEPEPETDGAGEEGGEDSPCSEECINYTCNVTDPEVPICYDTCTDNTQCASGFECLENACVEQAVEPPVDDGGDDGEQEEQEEEPQQFVLLDDDDDDDGIAVMQQVYNQILNHSTLSNVNDPTIYTLLGIPTNVSIYDNTICTKIPDADGCNTIISYKDDKYDNERTISEKKLGLEAQKLPDIDDGGEEEEPTETDGEEGGGNVTPSPTKTEKSSNAGAIIGAIVALAIIIIVAIVVIVILRKKKKACFAPKNDSYDKDAIGLTSSSSSVAMSSPSIKAERRPSSPKLIKEQQKVNNDETRPLPPHWKRIVDPNTGKTYFFNEKTLFSSWVFPDEDI